MLRIDRSQSAYLLVSVEISDAKLSIHFKLSYSFFSLFLFRRIVIVNILHTPYKMWYRWIEYVKKARHGGGQYFLIRLVLPPVLSC